MQQMPPIPRSPVYYAPGLELNEEDKIDPKALYTCVDQIWDEYLYGNWRTTRLKPPKPKTENGRLIFKAYKRVYGPFGPSLDNHTWIELKSEALTEFLRSEESLKGVEGLSQTTPGVDARDLFLRLAELKKLAVEPSVMPGYDAPVPSAGQTTSEKEPGLGLNLAGSTESAAPNDPIRELVSSDAPAEAGELSPKPKSDEGNDAPVATEPPMPVLEQLFILLKFIEDHFRDTVAELERLKTDGYMTFKLLWTLCVPGSVLETKDPATEYPIGVSVSSWTYGADGKNFNTQGAKYVWDGTLFKQNQVSTDIRYFKGLMSVKRLPIKVLSEKNRARLIERGRLYQKFAGINHLKYDSFITISASGFYYKRPAKGRVMVDAAGYYRFNINSYNGRRGPGGYGYESPRYPPAYPAYSSRKAVQVEEYDNEESLPDDILCLTPPTHLGWSFTAKVWGLILVDHLSEIVFDELAFDQLVVRPEYKKMIKALVETHAGQNDGLARDLVAGKGGGMVMVLHGKPGTGKTLTAEAISEHLKCPLYVVSSGELGIEASQLESQLSNILEMMASWKAIVLIDEADVFLEARNTHDLARNSLVSVFLRLLEYHTGVLILTTNRIRSFDKAFVSRFSIALRYPDLDQASRLLIWKEFLFRAGVTVGEPSDASPSKPTFIAYDDLVALSKKPFNGRVIKQLVRGAQALSIAEKEPLDLSHILVVLGVTEQFEADWKELEVSEDLKASGSGDQSVFLDDSPVPVEAPMLMRS